MLCFSGKFKNGDLSGENFLPFEKETLEFSLETVVSKVEILGY